jgi:hypothetical protein
MLAYLDLERPIVDLSCCKRRIYNPAVFVKFFFLFGRSLEGRWRVFVVGRAAVMINRESPDGSGSVYARQVTGQSALGKD